MNTLKRVLLGTTLLALVALSGQPVHADGNYTGTAQLVSPQGDSYPVVYAYGQVYQPASIPISVKQLFVQVTGATPSRTIYVGWNMYVKLTVQTPDGSHAGTYLTQDASNGLIPVQTKQDGSWTHYTSSGAASYSQTYTTSVVGGWTVDAYSGITDPSPNTYFSLIEGNFTTVKEYMV